MQYKFFNSTTCRYYIPLQPHLSMYTLRQHIDCLMTLSPSFRPARNPSTSFTEALQKSFELKTNIIFPLSKPTPYIDNNQYAGYYLSSWAMGYCYVDYSDWGYPEYNEWVGIPNKMTENNPIEGIYFTRFGAKAFSVRHGQDTHLDGSNIKNEFLITFNNNEKLKGKTIYVYLFSQKTPTS